MSRRPVTTHEQRVLIRKLYRIGREIRPLSLREIGDKFLCSRMTILRTVELDDFELEKMRRRQESLKSGPPASRTS